MLKELLAYVLDRTAPTQFRMLESDDLDRIFYDRQVFQAPPERTPPQAATRIVSSLAAVAEYLEANRDRLSLDKHIIHVSSPGEVKILGPLHPYHRVRECPLKAVYAAEGWAKLENWTDLDAGRIIVMVHCAPISGDHRDDLLSALSKVVKEKLEVREDGDGVSQTLTVKEGVQSLGLKRIENPVLLAPFATFPEVQQVLRPFVFRMDGNARFCLIPADGKEWEIEAVRRVKEHLAGLLGDASIDVPVIG